MTAWRQNDHAWPSLGGVPSRNFEKVAHFFLWVKLEAVPPAFRNFFCGWSVVGQYGYRQRLLSSFQRLSDHPLSTEAA